MLKLNLTDVFLSFSRIYQSCSMHAPHGAENTSILESKLYCSDTITSHVSHVATEVTVWLHRGYVNVIGNPSVKYDEASPLKGLVTQQI